MNEHGAAGWRNPWLRWSIVSVCVIAAGAVLVGFVWLPSAQSDFGAQGLWASICRAAGVAGPLDGPREDVVPGARSTAVVLDADMARDGGADAVGRGATLAQSCTGCHGARGLGVGSAPSLAGQWPEVIIKQLTDFRHGDRESSVMQAFAKSLSNRDTADVAAYYADLPAASHDTDRQNEPVPELVRVGAPMRNIAPCAVCHSGVERKLGAPRLEGLSKDYLKAQLHNFARGQRRNDSHAQMRNMARRLSEPETDALASYYARARASPDNSPRE